MSRSTHRRCRGERGGALIEFAIILPLLVMLVFGMLSGGIVMDRRASVNHGTREAARYGATVPLEQFGTPDAWADHIQAVAVERSSGVLDAEDVCVALMNGATLEASTDGAACISGDIDTGRRVQVTGELADQEINAIVASFPVGVQSDATAKYEE